MSKYNLTDILNEYVGGGRIGTLKISYKDLVDKMDDLEQSGNVVVRERGSSADGKVNREFEVVGLSDAVPGGNKQEVGFTVYDYKFGFDPGDEEHFDQEYNFSVGGTNLALAQDLGLDVKPYNFEENINEDEFDEARQKAIESSQEAAGIKEDAMKISKKNYDDYHKNDVNENIPPSREDNVIKDLVKADEVIKMIKMMNPDVREDLLKRIARMGQKMDENRREKNPEGMGQLYVQPAVQKAVKFHLDAYDKGDIDVDDMIQAIEDIIFGYVKAPGMSEQMYIDDEEFEMEMGRSKKDSLKKEMMIHVDQLIDGNIDMNDFMNVVEDVMAEVSSMKEVMGIDRKGNKKDDTKDTMLAKARATMKESSQEESLANYLIKSYTDPKTGKSMVDDRMISDFMKTVPEWEDMFDGSEEGNDSIDKEFEEFLFLNYDSIDEVKGKKEMKQLKEHFNRFK